MKNGTMRLVLDIGRGRSTLETSAVWRPRRRRAGQQDRDGAQPNGQVPSDYVMTRQTRIHLYICNFLNFTNFDVKC